MRCNTKRNGTLEKGDFYALIAPYYDSLLGAFLKPARNAITRSAGTHCRRILDVACGTGEQAILLANAGLDATGIDLSPAMLAIARRKGPDKTGFVLADAREMPFSSGTFDCVTVSLALHEMKNETRLGVVAEILRVLSPTGKLIVFDYGAPLSWKTAIGLSFLGFVERIAGGEHFKNFVQFTRNGGIDRFLSALPLKVVGSRNFFLGGIRLIFLVSLA